MYQMYQVKTAYDPTGKPNRMMLSVVECDERLPPPQPQLLATRQGVVGIQYYNQFSQVERVMQGKMKPRKHAVAKALIGLIEAISGLS